MERGAVEVKVLCGVPSGYGFMKSDGSGSEVGEYYGDGYGARARSGSGCGVGGFGDGYIDGSGDGDGSGSGNGAGCGVGEYGDGYVDGDGDGARSSGAECGNDSEEYWIGVLASFISQLPVAQLARVTALRAAGALIAFWRSDAKGCAVNGGRNQQVSPGTIEREDGPLGRDCGPGQLHATLRPLIWQGERWWIVALIGERREDDGKYWALEREIIGECR